ncbi:MAG: D-alanyl-D-alanine carboxypeptidase family protein [Candidatus Eisenbacteria bacterium]|nr:D-alanyl-D-alanine carboxypeptidase family protein [Candidatus Eisenbacteria bacterium]
MRQGRRPWSEPPRSGIFVVVLLVPLLVLLGSFLGFDFGFDSGSRFGFGFDFGPGLGFGAGTAEASALQMSPPRAVASILVEPTTGEVLYEQNADLPRAPASIAKLMLELIVLEKIQAGTLTLQEPIQVSAWASKIGGSQVYLAQGEVFPLEELLKAIVIHSANDACVAVAEHVAGSSEGFVDLMNIRAKELGLENTRYVNVHGLDDQPGEGNVTTARDISTIACRLVAMPHVLEWSSIQETDFRNGEFKLTNTNKLLGRFAGLDGLKTGYTEKAGFCLCSTAQRNGLRLISVVLGAESNRARFDESARLLGAGFAQLRKVTVFEAGAPLPGGVRISGGRKEVVPAVAGAPLFLVLPERAPVPAPVLVPRKGLKAPIDQGDTLGTVEVHDSDGKVYAVPALAAEAVGRATMFQWIGRLFSGGRK